MSDYVVRRPPKPAPPSPEALRHRKVALLTGAISLGLISALFSWIYLALVWDMSRMYGNDMPWANVPYALVPAVFIAGFVRCVLALNHREKPGLILLLLASFAVMGGAAVVLGMAGDAQNAAYRAAQTDIYLEGQRDTLRGLPMNQAPDGGAIGEPTCGTDGLCSIDVWVAGGSTAASMASMTTQMEAAGWTVSQVGPTTVMYDGPSYVVEATVTQTDDKGGTDFRVAVIK